MKWLYRKGIHLRRYVGWYARDITKRLGRYGALIKFAVQMMLKPKGTVFTCKGEVVSRVEYVKGLAPLFKQR